MTTELESVASAFKQWRLKNKRGCIPSYLKQKILQLTEHHSHEQLANTLGMSSSTLRRWRQSQQEQLTPQPAQFVPLQSGALSTTAGVDEGPAAIHLSMTLSNNLILELKGLSLSQVIALIKSFSAGSLL